MKRCMLHNPWCSQSQTPLVKSLTTMCTVPSTPSASTTKSSLFRTMEAICCASLGLTVWTVVVWLSSNLLSLGLRC